MKILKFSDYNDIKKMSKLFDEELKILVHGKDYKYSSLRDASYFALAKIMLKNNHWYLPFLLIEYGVKYTSNYELLIHRLRSKLLEILQKWYNEENSETDAVVLSYTMSFIKQLEEDDGNRE